MAIEIVSLSTGPMDNNTYVLGDPLSGEAAVVDPSFESRDAILMACKDRDWTLRAIWLTHAHFDHIAGIDALCRAIQPQPPVGLHPADLPLYQSGGGAAQFGITMAQTPDPAIEFSHHQTLLLGKEVVQVLHTPGHTPGHVVFFVPSAQAAVCGDLIFQRGVGRTDLPGGDAQTLLNSIRQNIFILDPDTRLLCGHGAETSVGEERNFNPFFSV